MSRRRKKRLYGSPFIYLSLLLCGGAMMVSFALLILSNTQTLTARIPSQPIDQPSEQTATQLKVEKLMYLPLLFEENQGQLDPVVAFQSKRGDTSLLFTRDSLVMNLGAQRLIQKFIKPGKVKISGQKKVETVSNYFIGNNPTRWHTKVANYAGIRYESLFPGIALEYASTDGGLRYQYLIEPRAKPEAIQFAFEGAEKISTADQDTTLVVQLKTGELRWTGLKAYQEKSGERVPVEVSFNVGKHQYGFTFGTYDRNLPLVIDPNLRLGFGTYLGGSGTESGSDTAVDSAGNVYVVLTSASTNYPTQNPYQGSSGGATDIVVTKMNATGTALVWSTYLGGAASESGTAVGLDSSNNVYAYGFTNGTGYPTVNAYQSTFNGLNDILLTKLSADGSTLLYSTYFGGTGVDVSTSGLTVSPAGDAVITGRTASSTSFPLLNAQQGTFGGGTQDVFVSRFAASGTLQWSTFLGGSVVDTPSNVFLDGVGNTFAVGNTSSTNFPTLNPYQAANAGSNDATLTKYSPTGTMLFSTYIGGSGVDQALGIAVDPSGAITIEGATASTNFPTLNPYQAANAGGTNDLFISRFNAAGSSLIWSTYLGTSGNDIAVSSGLAVDGGANVYVLARTDSTAFPMVNAYQATNAGGNDAVIVKFSANGQSLQFSSYFGGSGSDSPAGLSLFNSNVLYFMIPTSSADIVTSPGAFQPALSGTSDAFIAKIAFFPDAGGGQRRQTVSLTEPNGSEEYPSDQPINIRYATNETSPDGISLFYRFDPSEPWTLIEDALPSDVPYEWLPPRVEERTPTLLRIEFRDGTGVLLASDESDVSFYLLPGTPVPPSPPGSPAPEPAPPVPNPVPAPSPEPTPTPSPTPTPVPQPSPTPTPTPVPAPRPIPKPKPPVPKPVVTPTPKPIVTLPTPASEPAKTQSWLSRFFQWIVRLLRALFR